MLAQTKAGSPVDQWKLVRRSWLVLFALASLLFSAPSIAAEKFAVGPTSVVLGDKLATVQLPQGYTFIDKETAKKLLATQGETADNVLGMIMLSDKAARKANEFFVICEFEDCGYVKDDDAAKLNGDEILKAIKEGTQHQNERRKELKLPPIFVAGWAENPHYVQAAHHVVWAIGAKAQDDATAPVDCINYNTRILGRHGVLSMNLISSPEKLGENKDKVATLLNATTFNKGEAYADYQPGKDKAAGFGIAGLILGGGAVAAAAKFGLFGALSKWIIGIVLVLKKFIIVAVAGVGAFLSRLFKRGKEKPPAQ